jgi:hypothetical protein
MNEQNNPSSRRARKMQPFVVEFVKFSSGFVAIVAVGLLVLRAVGTAL